MAGFRSVAWKIGGRALQRSPVVWPAVEVEHELRLLRHPHVGLFGRPAQPPVARSRLFSSGGSETSEPLNKNCLNSRPGLAADVKSLDSLGSNGLRQQAEKKEELLHAVPKTPQPRSSFTPTMKLLTLVVASIPVMTVIGIFRIKTGPFPIDEQD